MNANAHDYHVSICQMDYNPENNSLEIAIKVFADDLELAIQNQGVEHYKLNTDSESDIPLMKYFQKKFQVKIDGKEVPLNWVGRELEHEVLWCYFEIPNIQNIKEITLSDALLLDVEDEQVNRVNFTFGEFKKSLIFKKDNPVQRLLIH